MTDGKHVKGTDFVIPKGEPHEEKLKIRSSQQRIIDSFDLVIKTMQINNDCLEEIFMSTIKLHNQYKSIRTVIVFVLLYLLILTTGVALWLGVW